MGVQGKTTSELAGLSGGIKSKESILPVMFHELARDMQQHGLHPNMIRGPIQDRLRELDQEYASKIATNQRLGGGNLGGILSARERALTAAEHRRQQGEGKDSGKQNQS